MKHEFRRPNPPHVKRPNKRGARAETSEPVIVPKPDMRRYNRGRYKVPEDLTFAEKMTHEVKRRTSRPDSTRWKTTNGVVDMVDNVQTYTGRCQRPGCKNWFSVTRTWNKPESKTRWPLYCSQTCDEVAAGITARKNSKRLRNGETSGKKRPDVARFDPDAVELPLWAAMDIVQGEVTATPTAYRQASEYLDEVEDEMRRGNRVNRFSRKTSSDQG